MKELITALIKAKAEFLPIRKDKVNPFFKSKYADLDSILNATEKALGKHGLTIIQTLNDYSLITTLWHISGESIESRYPLEAAEDGKRSKSQSLGAALTYARRYAICAILNITADDDEDGNEAKSTQPTAATTSNSRKNGELSREEWLARQGRSN